MRRELRLSLSLLVLGVGTARAEEGEGLPRLFPRTAEIQVSAPSGLCRLRLPAEVLAASTATLSDVRVFDAQGAEVPFLIDSAARPVRARTDRVTERPAKPLSVRRESRARPGLVPLNAETFRLAVPESGNLELVLSSPAPSFVRSVVVRSTPDGRVLASGSVFRLTAPLRERVDIRLPNDLPPEVEVVVEGEGRYLEPTFAFRSVERAEVEGRLAVPLVEIGRRREAGHTLVELARPRGLVPDRLALRTSTGTFHRWVTLRDSGPGGEGRTLARGSVFRAESTPPVSELELALSVAPASDRLELDLDDAASPALDGLEVSALVSQPTLVFEAERGRVLYFGGGRARRSDYDVQRFQGSTLGHALMDGSRCEAALGSPRDNPRFDPKPALEFALRPGPAVELSRFSHRRALRVESAPEGLSRVLLAPEDIALLRSDLADLRIVDADGRQWPHLIERSGVALEVPLGVRATSPRPQVTRLALELPRAPLTLDGVTLNSPAEYVNRDVRLVAVTEDGQRRMLHQGTLQRRPGSGQALSLAFPAERATLLELEIDDASDAPLVVHGVSARVAAGEVFLAAPPGEYTMLLGDTRREPARYELGRARDLALAVPVASARPGAFGANPDYVRPSRVRPPAVALWAAIVFAVAVLGALTLRLARREGEGEASAPLE